MLKKFLPLIVVLAVIAFIAMGFAGQYNSLVRMQEGVNAQWGNVENVYQRRADLIPNLVETVKGYAAHERQTLEAVIQARAEATKVQATMTPEMLNDPAALQKFQAAQQNLGSALARLMVVVEQYPNLKANENFRDLQAQLEGTENRIAVERRRFNELAQSYNVGIRRFPTNILAGMFHFTAKAYFEAAAGAQNAPKVQF